MIGNDLCAIEVLSTYGFNEMKYYTIFKNNGTMCQWWFPEVATVLEIFFIVFCAFHIFYTKNTLIL